MRIFTRVVLTMVGVVLLVVGGAAAVFVGPDDSVVVGETEFSEGTAYTAPDLFTVANVAVVVTAEATEGEAFVGVAHPVDVDDAVAGHDAFRISDLALGTVDGSPDAGEEPAPDPRGIDYVDSVSGEGEQVLSFLVDDVEPRFVIYPPDGAPVTTSIAFTVEGAFLVAVGVAVLGLLVVVGGWLLTRRRRPREPQGAGAADAGTGVEAPVAETAPAGSPGAGSGASTVRRVGAALGAGALLLPVTACAGLPAPLASSEATKVAISADDLDEMWVGYDERRSAAVESAAKPTFDTKAWGAADTGPVLETDQYWTTLDKEVTLDKESEEEVELPPEVKAATSSGEWVSSPAFGEYPMWALADKKSVAPGEKADDEASSVALIVRAGADAPWKVSSVVRVPADEMLELPAVAADPTEQQVSQVDEVAAAIASYLESGKAPEIVADHGALEESRKTVAQYVDGWSEQFTVTATVTPLDEGSMHIVPADDVVFAVIDQVVKVSSEFPREGRYWWNGARKAVNGTTESTLYFEEFVSTFVEIPAEGPATVIGSTMSRKIAGG